MHRPAAAAALRAGTAFIDRMSAAAATLAQLQALHAQAADGALAVDALAARVRASAPPLLAALPPAFGPVLDNLLLRLESAASFTDESCAVSQRDLLAAFGQWLDKAALRLPR